MDKLRKFLSGEDESPDEESGIMAQVIQANILRMKYYSVYVHVLVQ